MAEIQNLAKFLNPLTLHLQKLDLEFKCPICWKLLNKPMLLPCNHIVCDSCVPSPIQNKSECPTCEKPFSVRDIRPAPFMESLVTIYRSLRSAFTSVTSRNLSAEQGQACLAPAHIDKLKEDPNTGDEVGNSAELCLGKTNVDRNPSLSPLSSYGCKGNNVGHETQEEDMRQGPELPPESSPSSADSKDRDCNGSASGSRCGSIKKCKAKMSVEYSSEAMCYARESKRQKMLDYSSPEAGVSNGLTEEKVYCSDNTAISNCKLGEHLYAAQPTPISLKRSVCAFCHTSKQTDGTGSLLYYANGREVDGEMITMSYAIPVHSKCIEWTPLVYYKGETIKNLESELGRSAKLKCTSCGMKGAALGCFEKSCRRTYHVPCAFKIQECRWDCEDFLMLCPVHNSLKFPKEKSKPRKSASEFKHPMSTEMILSNEFWATSPHGPKEWVFCGSALSSGDKFILVEFASMCGALVSKFWRPNVTHVIAATDEKGACTRTLKVLMGILNGRWILNMGWIKACMKASQPLNEEPYEISLDNHGCLNGPKTGRLRALNKEAKLFEGVNFYFTGDFVPAYKFDLLDLVRTAGGTIIESMEQLMTLSHDGQATSTCLVVYNGDPSQGCSSSEDSSTVSQRLAEARDLANQMNSSVVAHKLILDSIATCLC